MKSDIKIFLVDDDPFSLYSYKGQLEHSGYKNIWVLRSGEDCIRHLGEKPQVIFLDHQMDQLNGIEVLQKIKRYCPEVRVVIVSGRDCVNTAVNSMKLGAYDYILKGEEEMKRMLSILRQINLDKIETIRNKTVLSPLKDLTPLVIFISLLLILQSGVVIYYYSSLMVSVLSLMVLTLGVGLVLTRSHKVRRILSYL